MLSDRALLNILTQSKDATAVYDSAELHICFVNPAMLSIWGKDKNILGKTFEEALPEMKDQPFTKLLKTVWQTGKSYKATDMPATLFIDGRLKTSYFDFEYNVINNEQGGVLAILHTATDVSSRLQALQQVSEKQQREDELIAELKQTGIDREATNKRLTVANHKLTASNENIGRLNQRLQESETDFKRLVEQAPVAILVFRGENLVIDLVNEEMLRVLGKDHSIMGKPLLDGLPELEGQPAVDLLFEVFHTGKSTDGIEAPVRMMHNGQLETHYFNFSYRPLLDHGKIIGVMDVAVEVTEQVLARQHLESIIAEKTFLEQNLRANEQRLQGILDTMAEGVVIVDKNAVPTYANAMAQRIMGMDEACLKGRRYNDEKWKNERVDGTPLPIEDHPLYVVLETGLAVYDQEIGIVPSSGEKMYISINAAPVINEEQEVTGGIVTFTDVTNRRKILQQKEDFISVASHELRTPITSLKAALQLLERMQENIKPEMLFKLVAQANKSLNKLSDLVNSLLNSNRISQGRFPIHRTKFKAASLVNDCCQHVHTTGSHDIVLKGDLDTEVFADEQLLDQVIVNMVNNAVKYAPDSRQIVIEVKKMDDCVKIIVSDSGPGIPVEISKQIFERYYQAHDDSRQFSGLGLGLYISAEIIQKHGGKIGVDSTPGKGSAFWFTVPNQ